MFSFYRLVRAVLPAAALVLFHGGALAQESVSARDYMVAAANPHAVRAGIEMLAAGGKSVV